MAKKKEQPVVDNEVGKLKVKEKTEAQPTGNETEGSVTKVQEKMKMKPIDMDKEVVTKVDLSKSVEAKEDKEEVVETTEKNEIEPKEEIKPEETPVLEEVIEEEVEKLEEQAEEAIIEAQETGKPLPENIEKLVNFMEETGGDLNDYVALNQDYSKLDNQDLLYEYYRKTKPHLDSEEINFLMEDQFSYDENDDSEKEIKRKKLALKEQVASAKSHLDGLKSKYYKDIKMGSKLTPEQQKAIDFFNRYKKSEQEQQQVSKKRQSTFLKKTDQVFNDKFKGFEYNVGDRRFRFNVSNADKVKDSQVDINNFIGKFLDKNNEISDAKGYHKGLFTAMNADAIANHFYEQGKTDALKDSISKSKNIDMSPRQAYGEIEKGGIKVRTLNDDGPDFKFKIKNK